MAISFARWASIALTTDSEMVCAKIKEGEIGVRKTLAARMVDELNHTDRSPLDLKRCSDDRIDVETDSEPGSASEDRIGEWF